MSIYSIFARMISSRYPHTLNVDVSRIDFDINFLKHGWYLLTIYTQTLTVDVSSLVFGINIYTRIVSSRYLHSGTYRWCLMLSFLYQYLYMNDIFSISTLRHLLLISASRHHASISRFVGLRPIKKAAFRNSCFEIRPSSFVSMIWNEFIISKERNFQIDRI